MDNLEIEAKFIYIDLIDIRERLEKIGFRHIYPEFDVFRATLICHDPNMTLRVRKEYGQITMTYKYTNKSKGALGTEEIEIEVDDFDSALEILKRANNPLRVLFQESKRELWKKGDIEVSIDEWPGTGKYLEIEAPSEDILQRMCEDLGLNYSEALFGRIGVVYEKLGYNLDYINSIENLTFENPPIK